jgi:hypothetical protein
MYYLRYPFPGQPRAALLDQRLCDSGRSTQWWRMKSNATAPSHSLAPLPDPITTARLRDASATTAKLQHASHEEILHRAYAIWEHEGHPEDRQVQNWLQAENEVCGTEKWGRA